jgi:hypothetical protein
MPPWRGHIFKKHLKHLKYSYQANLEGHTKYFLLFHLAIYADEVERYSGQYIQYLNY